MGTIESLGPFDNIHQGLSQKTNKFSESGATNKPPGTNSNIPRIDRAKLVGTIESLGPFDDTHQRSIHEMNKRSEGGKTTGYFDLPRYFSEGAAASKFSNTNQAKVSENLDLARYLTSAWVPEGAASKQ